MDEYVVIERRREINVWDHEGSVCLAVEYDGDRTTLTLNPLQVDRLIALLQEASRQALEKTT